MKTDDLVLMLATGAGVAPKHVAARRYTIALGWGMPISFALMLATIGLLSDIRGALALSGFWIKLGFVVSLAAVSLLSTLRLSRPGADRKSLPVLLSLSLSVIFFTPSQTPALSIPAILSASPVCACSSCLSLTVLFSHLP